MRKDIEVKKVEKQFRPAFLQVRKWQLQKKKHFYSTWEVSIQVRALPGPEVSQLICHLPQGFAGAQDLSALFACTQLSCLASLIKDLPYGLLTSIPWDTPQTTRKVLVSCHVNCIRFSHESTFIKNRDIHQKIHIQLLQLY